MFSNIAKIWKSGGQEEMLTPIDETVIFNLKYKRLTVGILKLEKGTWSFRYSEDFKSQDLIKPLSDFPDTDKVYESQELYPFFLHRIPSTKQPKVQKVIKEKNLDSTNEAVLLKFFGKESISNPFSLVHS